MRAIHLEILVEEPSMEAFLRQVLPGMLGQETSFQVYPFQGKDDLLAKLPDRLQGYANWLPVGWRIVVVVDRDNDDCQDLKQRLERMAAMADLATRTAADRPWQVVNRIAIEELEAWYFGDWAAVRQAFPKISKAIPGKAPYRHPDAIAGGTWEAFERILQQAGYFKGGLRKTEVARAMGSVFDVRRNTSPSFLAFREILLESLSNAPSQA